VGLLGFEQASRALCQPILATAGGTAFGDGSRSTHHCRSRPATYITPANPQGNGFIPLPYDAHHERLAVTGSVHGVAANMVVEAQYSAVTGQLALEADINQVPVDKLEGPGGTAVPRILAARHRLGRRPNRLVHRVV